MKKRWGCSADWVFGGMLVVVVCLYLSVIRLGMADMDEGFYLTIPFRMTQGDILLVDEWHVSQLSSFLVYPWMKLYLAMSDGTEGIILAFRYIYLFVQLAVTVAGYLLMRKRGPWMAAAVSLVYALFTPFGIKALSYNTMGLMAVYLFTLLGMTESRHTGSRSMMMGILLAAAVLCNPYMTSLYIGHTLLTLMCQIKGKVSLRIGETAIGCGRMRMYFTWSRWLSLTAGAGILLALFLGFELSGASMGQLLDNLQFVVSDPAHPSKNLFQVTRAFTWYVEQYPVHFVVWMTFTAVGTAKRTWSGLFFAGISVLTAVWMLQFALGMTNGIGYSAIMLPMSLTGISAYLFTRERKRELLGGWLLGIFYGFCMGASSNNGIYTFANACTVSSCVSLWMIGEYVKEQVGIRQAERKKRCTPEKAGLTAALAILLVIQLFSEGYVLLNHIFWESGPEALTGEIEAGPLGGLYTTPDKKERYMINYRNALKLSEEDGEYVMFYRRFPSGYLLLDQWRNGGCSAWLADSMEDLSDPRMIEYAEHHPERQPDVIYVDSESTGVWTSDRWEMYCVDNGYRLELLEGEGYALIRDRKENAEDNGQ